MPMDGLVVAALVPELQSEVAGAHIQKIYQPVEHQFLFGIYLRRRRWLALSLEPTYPSLCLLEDVSSDNPPSPPSFCMLLRKYLEGGRIIHLDQEGWDRVIYLHVEAGSSPAPYTLVCELTGRHSNLVLLSSRSGEILGVLRPQPERDLLPHRIYSPPPSGGRRPATEIKEEDLWAALDKEDPSRWPTALTRLVGGLSPLTARGILRRAGWPWEGRSPDRAATWQAFSAAAISIGEGRYTPTLLCSVENGRPQDLSALWVEGEPGLLPRPASSMLEAVAALWVARTAPTRAALLRAALLRHLETLIQRVKRKLEKQEAALEEASAAEEERFRGELILAHLHQIRPGQRELQAADYRFPDGRLLLIPLDPALSGAENAQVYFRRYQKMKKTLEAAAEQAERSQQELAYLEEVMALAAQAEETSVLEEMIRELQAEGYHLSGLLPSSRPSPRQPRSFLRFRSSDGWTILVGQTNRENEEITFHLAGPADLWLHARQIPGAHVVIRREGRAEIPATTLEEAAALAAYFSQARASSQVPVDYTERRHVRKLPGGKPGLVLYTHHSTLVVKPEGTLVERLRIKNGKK